jgi:hypothetical protein
VLAHGPAADVAVIAPTVVHSGHDAHDLAPHGRLQQALEVADGLLVNPSFGEPDDGGWTQLLS